MRASENGGGNKGDQIAEFSFQQADAQPQKTKPKKKKLNTVRDPHPPSHRLLASFSDASDLARWKVFSDAAHGGTTEASLAASRLFPGTAEFRGALAAPGAAGRARSGFAGMTVQLSGGGFDNDDDEEKEEEETFSGRRAAGNGGDAGPPSSSRTAPPAPLFPPLDLSAFDALRLRVRNGDGRPWVVSLRTENWLVGDAGGGGCHDVWQAFLCAPDARRKGGKAGAGSWGRQRGGGGATSGGGSSGDRESSSGGVQDRDRGGWTTAELPLSRFLLTHRGRLVESRVSMNAARVVSLGLAPAPLPSSSLSSSSSSRSTTFDGGEESGEEGEAPPSPPAAAEGAFCLGLDSITAVSTTRGLLTREEAEEAERTEREQSRERHGKT